MAALEELIVGARVEGLVSTGAVTIENVKRHGNSAVTVWYRDSVTGHIGDRMVYRSDEHNLTVLEGNRAWSFDGDAGLFRLVSEANRIRLAYLFDPMLAVHISNVEPLPHQIAAVYESMLSRQPLRFLLADDPGAGKTIMAGLLIRELMLRGDLERCLIVVPASLAEQWQEELHDKFGLEFRIINRSDIEGSLSNNPFAEHNLLISRVDMLKQDENMERLQAVEWDLVVVDEAHKMSASYFGNDLKKTARYRLGESLGETTRHLLLMTATPHSGKHEDFQLFMSLLDADRFAGAPRDGVHQVDPSDMMRRMLKEDLVDFEGKKLFPERRAYTVRYELSDEETRLYEKVTHYVSTEMNRAERYAQEEGGNRRKTVVGFALTVLQRRLASSPAAIHESLKRRLTRLEHKLEEAKQAHRAAKIEFDLDAFKNVREDDLEDDLEELPENELDNSKGPDVLDLATASHTVEELQAEIDSLRELEKLAKSVRQSGTDTKWDKLREVLEYPEMFDMQGSRRKLVIFTEHRDTLRYLVDRIGNLIGNQDSIVSIDGSMGRESRRAAQSRFVNDDHTLILIATDAAGEGVNLQRAHLMVNYDLPWNPNRIEQRFGRIHRFGQHETCHIWNLVAHQTREGAVYQRLFEKLENEREALQGQVFDVLGRLFTEVALRDLMVEAIRFNTSEEAQQYAEQQIDQKWDSELLQELLKEHALDATTFNAARLRELKDEMDRAEARKLVPYFIESFFVDAFKLLGGSLAKREPRRYQISHVPADLRRRDRLIGRQEPISPRYERICFDKADVHINGKPDAAFVHPGHPLLQVVIDVVLERYREVLRQGAVLVDDAGLEANPRVLFSVQSDVTDGRITKDGNRRLVSRRVDYVEVDSEESTSIGGAAPYLDYRPLTDEEHSAAAEVLSADWLKGDLEEHATDIAIGSVVQEHLEAVRSERMELADRTMAAVRARLTSEIQYWDHRAEELRLQEQAGKKPRLNSANARRRCDELEARLETRTKQIQQERDIAAQPPVVHGAALVIPAHMLTQEATVEVEQVDRQRIEAIAMAHVMELERQAGRDPVDVSKANRGWDIESRDSAGDLRFIEVKGRHAGAQTVCVTKNELLTCLNKREQFYLAVVVVDGDQVVDSWIRQDPLQGDWSFALTSQNLDLETLQWAAAR